MVNIIPPDLVDEVHVLKPNQHDDVLVVPKPVLVDEDEDPKEEKFKEDEDPQEEEEDDMEIDIKEDENEPELTYPYEEVDPLNPPPPASESKPNEEIKVENPIEHEYETVPASVYKVAHALVEKKGKAKDKLYGKIILELGNKVRSSVEQGMATMEKLVEKLENIEDKVECKKLKKELEEARLFFMRCDIIMPPKSAPITQAAIRRMIKDSVDAAIVAERARQANVINDASGSGPARGAVELRRWFEKTKIFFEISECAKGKKVMFAAAILEGPALTWWKTKVATIEKVQRMEHKLWNLKVKEYDVAYTQMFNELALMCLRMVEPERVKVDAYIQGNHKLEMQGFWMERSESGRAFKVEIVVVKAIKRITLVILWRIAKSKEMRELWLPLLLMESFLCVNGERKPRKGQNKIKNGKRVKAEKSLKQLQWVEEEKLSKTQKEWPKMQTQSKAIQVLKE
nr:hypothetical protein [Tanacetum cinerariifolium]